MITLPMPDGYKLQTDLTMDRDDRLWERRGLASASVKWEPNLKINQVDFSQSCIFSIYDVTLHLGYKSPHREDIN